jgi:uncharacterized protein (TIGR00251 family)
MKISVRVKPRSSKIAVVVQEDGTYLVSLKAPPVEGKANDQLLEVLAEYFDRPRRDITILKGTNGRFKIVEIL